jgi:hypothetical protein
VGVGRFASHQEAVARVLRVEAEIRPDPALHDFYVKLLAIYREAQQRLAPIDHALPGLRPPEGG